MFSHLKLRLLKIFCCSFVLQLLKDCGEDAKKIGIMVASHNEDTVRFAIERMKEIGISPEDKVICFGQLLGMCDYITFPLGTYMLLHLETTYTHIFPPSLITLTV